MALKKVNPKINLYVIYPIIGIIIGIVIGGVILILTKPNPSQIAAQKTETPIILGKEVLALPGYADLKNRQPFGKLPIEIGKTGKEEPFKTIKK